MRLAALALASLSLAGCYRAHGVGDAGPPPVSPRDAGIDAGLDGPRDAGRDAARDGGIDAGSDAGLCPGVSEEPLLHVCSFEALGGLPAGEPATLTLFYAECVCAARGCGAQVEGGTIALDTWRCPETAECDDCTTDLGCAIPPLVAGTYEVRVDGARIGTIAASPSAPVARPTCWDVQDPIEGASCGGVSQPVAPRVLCHRPLEDVGTQVEITMPVALPPCIMPGECRASLDGRQILLSAATLSCGSEEECGGPPVERAIRCITPPLRDGDYTIRVEGSMVESALRIRDITGRGEIGCTSIP